MLDEVVGLDTAKREVKAKKKSYSYDQKALEEIKSEIETIKDELAKLKKGMPLESGMPLQYCRGIKRN